MAITADGFGRFGGRISDIEAPVAALALAALVFVPVFHTKAALVFLLFGMGILATRPNQTLTDLWRFRWVLVLPVFCVLSMLWSELPGASLRAGIQLLATFLIAVVLAARMPQTGFLLVLWAALTASVVLSLAFGHVRADTGALVGLYDSKNAMAWAAALASLLSIGIAAARTVPGPLRLMAAAAAPICIAAMILAQSVSALGYLPIGICAFLAVQVMRRMRVSTRVVLTAFLALAGSYVLLLATLHADALAAMFFNATGKDVTLTGRTDLWLIAVDYIREKPWLGLGYQAFWVPGNPTAEAIWQAFGIASRSGFNFHNTYLSNAVEIGLIGVLIQTVLLGAAIVLSAGRALTSHNTLDALMFACVVMLVSITPIEVPVFHQFTPQAVLIIAAVIYSASRGHG
ncbi:MAG: O-antigen ligase family protein [Pseudomonadota bacterium]